MFNQDQIVNELLAGTTADEIAAKMAETLNAAVKEKESIEAAAAEAKAAEAKEEEAKKEAEKDAKVNRMYEIVEEFQRYMADFVSDEYANKLQETLDDDDSLWELCKMIDSMVELAQLMDKLTSKKECSCGNDKKSLLDKIFGDADLFGDMF